MDDLSKYLCAAPITKVPEKRTKEVIADVEDKIQKCCAKIHAANTRKRILDCRGNKLKHFLLQVDEISRRLKVKHDKCKERNTQFTPVYYTKENIHGGSNIPEVESTCTREVYDICKSIKNLLLVEKMGDSMETEASLSKKVEELYNTHSPSELHQSIILVIQESTQQMKELISKIDLMADAKNLKFKFETGSLHDFSDTPVLLQTMHQLIEQGQMSHFQKFISRERSENEVCRMKKQLHDTNKRIDDVIAKLTSERRAKLRAFLTLQQESSGCIASQQYLQEQLDVLRNEHKEKMEASVALHQKFDLIKSFEETVQTNQSTIQGLILDNGTSKSRHRHSRNEILSSIQKKIDQLIGDLEAQTNALVNLQNEELSQCIDIPLQKLQSISLSDLRLVSDLSIHRLNPGYVQPGQEKLKKILREHQVANFTAPEFILQELVNNNQLPTDMAGDEDMDIRSSLDHLCANVEDLCANKSVHSTAASCLPRVEECEKKSHVIAKECEEFQSAADTWWNQPAQLLVPWITEDGLSINQYLDHYRAHAAMLT